MSDFRSILRRLDQLERAYAALAKRVPNLPARFAAGGASGIAKLTVMVIKTAADSKSVAVCNRRKADGTADTSKDIPVLVRSHRAAGQSIYAMSVTPNTGVSFSSKPVTWEEVTTNVVFFVTLVRVGGASGTNKTAACTYTYDVKDVTGTYTLGTAIALTGNGNGWRGLLLQLTAGTKGMAYIASDGTVKLILADEKPAGEQNCT